MAMPHSFAQLMAEIHTLTLLPKSLLHQELVHLSIKGVDFSMYPVVLEDQACLVLHCDLGELPETDREAVLIRLLDNNFYMIKSIQPVSFCRNEESGRILLSAVQPLAMISARTILDQMGSLADYALHWRTTFFLSCSLPERQGNGEVRALAARTVLAPEFL